MVFVTFFFLLVVLCILDVSTSHTGMSNIEFICPTVVVIIPSLSHSYAIFSIADVAFSSSFIVATISSFSTFKSIDFVCWCFDCCHCCVLYTGDCCGCCVIKTACNNCACCFSNCSILSLFASTVACARICWFSLFWLIRSFTASAIIYQLLNRIKAIRIFSGILHQIHVKRVPKWIKIWRISN